MPAMNRVTETLDLQRKTVVQGKLGDKTPTWTTQQGVEAGVYLLSGQQVQALGAKYQETSHLILTRVRGIKVGEHRLVDSAGVVYEPTFVNESGRRTQVYAKVQSGD